MTDVMWPMHTGPVVGASGCTCESVVGEDCVAHMDSKCFGLDRKEGGAMHTVEPPVETDWLAAESERLHQGVISKHRPGSG